MTTLSANWIDWRLAIKLELRRHYSIWYESDGVLRRLSPFRSSPHLYNDSLSRCKPTSHHPRMHRSQQACFLPPLPLKLMEARLADVPPRVNNCSLLEARNRNIWRHAMPCLRPEQEHVLCEDNRRHCTCTYVSRLCWVESRHRCTRIMPSMMHLHRIMTYASSHWNASNYPAMHWITWLRCQNLLGAHS